MWGKDLKVMEYILSINCSPFLKTSWCFWCGIFFSIFFLNNSCDGEQLTVTFSFTRWWPSWFYGSR